MGGLSGADVGFHCHVIGVGDASHELIRYLATEIILAWPNCRLTSELSDDKPWYANVTRYQWLVLVIASAGWVFDVYESQVFAITRNQMLPEILRGSGDVKNWGDILFAVFLLGGTVGGLAAGSLADRYGRRPILILTILLYSLFSGLTFFATELWQVAVLRFLVAIGVGGEWAVAASLVAEVFPIRARAHASGIFHASSVLGTWMAGLVGMAIGAQWRYAYLFGVFPALLILWVRARVREPEMWQAKATEATQSPRNGAQLGSFRSLLLISPWNRHAFAGLALAGVGLGTFWAVTVAGQNLAEEMLLRNGATAGTRLSRPSSLTASCKLRAAGWGCCRSGRSAHVSADDARSSAFSYWRVRSCRSLVLFPKRTGSY